MKNRNSLYQTILGAIWVIAFSLISLPSQSASEIDLKKANELFQNINGKWLMDGTVTKRIINGTNYAGIDLDDEIKDLEISVAYENGTLKMIASEEDEEDGDMTVAQLERIEDQKAIFILKSDLLSEPDLASMYLKYNMEVSAIIDFSQNPIQLFFNCSSISQEKKSSQEETELSEIHMTLTKKIDAFSSLRVSPEQLINKDIQLSLNNSKDILKKLSLKVEKNSSVHDGEEHIYYTAQIKNPLNGKYERKIGDKDIIYFSCQFYSDKPVHTFTTEIFVDGLRYQLLGSFVNEEQTLKIKGKYRIQNIVLKPYDKEIRGFHPEAGSEDWGLNLQNPVKEEGTFEGIISN